MRQSALGAIGWNLSFEGGATTTAIVPFASI
jgi:hypothetical protein